MLEVALAARLDVCFVLELTLLGLDSITRTMIAWQIKLLPISVL